MTKKYYPKIKFIINKDLDKDHILKRDRNLAGFLPPGMSFVTRKEFIKNKDKILSAYVDEFYAAKIKHLRESVKDTKAKWSKVEKTFFRKVDHLFHNWPWPRGNYRGYVSIALSCPRNIKEKFFAFPQKIYWPGMENRDLKVVAHEMLHFMEYDYLQNKFGLTPSHDYSKDNTFWQFTENLNVLIENSDDWKEFNLGLKWKPYSDCAEMYKKMKKVWDKTPDVDALVEAVFGVKVKPVKK